VARKGLSVGWTPDGASLVLITHAGARSLSRRQAPGPELYRIVDPATGRERFTLERRPGPRGGLIFSPDGKRLAFNDGTALLVCDATTGKVIRTLTGGFLDSGGAFSPDGNRLAVSKRLRGGPSSISILNVATGKELLTIPPGFSANPFFSPDRPYPPGSGPGDAPGTSGNLVFSPDGTRLAMGWFRSARTGRGLFGLRVLDAATGKDLLKWLAPAEPDWSGRFGLSGVRPVFSPDGKRLAVAVRAGRDSKDVKLWDIAAGKEVLSLHGVGDHGTWIAFSPDGKRLLTAGGSTVKLWDVQPDRPESAEAPALTLRGHTQRVDKAVFAADGRRLFTAGQDGLVKVWDTTARENLLTIPAPAGELLLRAWALKSQHMVTMDNVSVRSGNRLAAKGEVKLWDLAGRARRSFQVSPGEGEQFTRIDSTEDGSRLATGAARGTAYPDGTARLQVWDAAGKELFSRRWPRVRLPHTQLSFALSPDGKRLACGVLLPPNRPGASPQAELTVWDVDTRAVRLRLRREAVVVEGLGLRSWRARFSPDGKHLAVTWKGTTLWDLETRQELFSLPGDFLAFSPDGRRLLVSGGGTRRGGGLSIWSAGTGKKLAAIQGHVNAVTSAAFSPDGRRLATVARARSPTRGWETSEAGEVKLWDTEAGGELLTFKTLVGQLAFSQDGTRLRLACNRRRGTRWQGGSADSVIQVWDATPVPR
jgi:WD40 repeat protein